jgi:hypothetical protein
VTWVSENLPRIVVLEIVKRLRKQSNSAKLKECLVSNSEGAAHEL